MTWWRIHSKGVLMPVSRELGLPLKINRELGFGS